MNKRERAAERRKRMIVHYAKNFQDAEEWDRAFWQSVTPEEQMSVMVGIRRNVEEGRLRAPRPEK